MADATLSDVVKKLEEVKSAVKAGDKVTATAAAKAEEAGAEGAREDSALKKIFEDIRDKIGLKGSDSGKDGFDGYAKAKEWGTSKTSAVMGSVLGGTGSGFKNAFKNAGK